MTRNSDLLLILMVRRSSITECREASAGTKTGIKYLLGLLIIQDYTPVSGISFDLEPQIG